MPRIATALLRKAHAIDPFLPALLRPCRDLYAAQNELRWLREHVEKIATTRRERDQVTSNSQLLRQLVRERASGKPLQYILGSEYFGDLEICCRPGVLIPRQDTAASITHLVRLLHDGSSLPSQLSLLDLCTGTGCIPLLFEHELCSMRRGMNLRMLGVDISNKALDLALFNSRKIRTGKKLADKGHLNFMKADVLGNSFVNQFERVLPFESALSDNGHPQSWDILISNPPYISPSHYWKTTTRSVRGYEPKLALVPPPVAGQNDIEQGDLFYPRLLNIAQNVQAKIVLFEVADLQQAMRVAKLAQSLNVFQGIEIWREDPRTNYPTASDNCGGIAVKGEGNARSVLCYNSTGASWLGNMPA